MKEDWIYKKLGEVCEVYGGQGAPQGEENYCDDGIPFIKAGNLEELINGLDEDYIQKVNEDVAKSHKLKLYKAGSVVFAKSGMSCMKGLVYTLKHDCYVVSHLAILTPKKVTPSFLNYILNHFKPNTLVKDEAYPSISLSDISQFSIPVPPIETQSRIVSELDILQSIIDKQKAQLKEYDNLAQSIFYDMFGDPVENEKGWKEKKFGLVFRLKSGDGLSEKNFLDGDIRVYGGNGVSGYHNEFNKSGKHIIIGRVGAYCGNVRFVQGNFWLTDNAFDTIFDNNELDYWYTCYLLNTIDLHRFANHAAQPVISNVGLKDIQIVLPPFSLQQSFAKKIFALEKQKAAIRKSIIGSRILFNYTMDKYFG